MEKKIHMRTTGEEVNLMLWDTAGQEMFTKLTKQYYRGAGAVVYVFSTVDRESFLEIERWRQKVTEECGPDIASVLVQNKIDLLDQVLY
jgi:Ras-related protein Rab-23